MRVCGACSPLACNTVVQLQDEDAEHGGGLQPGVTHTAPPPPPVSTAAQWRGVCSSSDPAEACRCPVRLSELIPGRGRTLAARSLPRHSVGFHWTADTWAMVRVGRGRPERCGGGGVPAPLPCGTSGVGRRGAGAGPHLRTGCRAFPPGGPPQSGPGEGAARHHALPPLITYMCAHKLQHRWDGCTCEPCRSACVA